MTINQIFNKPWTRKHDVPGSPLIPKASKIFYPKSLEDLIQICSNRKPSEHFKAAGSHWALSPAAISDSVFIETHDPNNQFPAMGRTLYNVVPRCLKREFVEMLKDLHPQPFNEFANSNEGVYLVHCETGKRIYQLYSELDLGDDRNSESLARYIESKYGNSSYRGPWAFQTLGGAGGQTVFGALTTGTHGGDFNLPPIADSVMALHLVADGGKHYWIEPGIPFKNIQLTDDEKLNQTYGTDQYRGRMNSGRENFKIIRDDEIFNAVLVSAGRFGIVYSVVMRVVRQYLLHESRRISTWQDIKSQVSDISSDLYKRPNDNRFLQIAICLTPHSNFQKNLCGITKRWNVKSPEVNGRKERCGKVLEAFNANIQGPLFEYSGRSYSYSPDPNHSDQALPPSFLERACSNSNFMNGVIEEVIEEVRQLIDNNAVLSGSAIAAVVTIGGTIGLTILLTALAVILALLLAFLSIFNLPRSHRLGQTMNDLKNMLLDRTDPNERAAGLFVWQCIAYKIFESQQDNLDFTAISYAVMDRHNYLDRSCDVNVDSIEVFFNVSDPNDKRVIAFVDALIAYEIKQEFRGLAFVGYISLRFTGKTRSLLGMERFPMTCAVEVAGLKDVSGSRELIDYAISLSLNRNFRGILHWGQRNESSREDIEFRFGNELQSWRDALINITENGTLDGFSSQFTRRVGLEPF